MNIQHKNGYNNNKMSTTTCQQQHHHHHQQQQQQQQQQWRPQQLTFSDSFFCLFRHSRFGMQIKIFVSRNQTKNFPVRTDIFSQFSIMIYFLYLAWALAVRRDTQGSQWNKQTWFSICNDRMRRTDAMMGCHRRYASVLKALLTTDAEDITCGQKRHTRNSGST